MKHFSNQDDIYGAVIMAQSHCGSSLSLFMQTK